jgi:solute:Na+ symporter, SSS family
VIFIQPQFAIGFQFLGGAWILQIFPAFVLGLYTRWFHPKALIIGWVVGIAAGTYMAVVTQFTANYPLHLFGETLIGYGPFYALILNLLVAVVATWILNAARVASGTDATSAADYA